MRTAFAAAVMTAALLTAPAALAQDVAWNAGVFSDYRFRGFSQTDEGAALQAGVDATAGGLYGGAWISNVDFGDDTEAEVDFYGGYRTVIGGFNVDVGGVVYLYVGSPAVTDYDYVEAKVAVSRAVGPVTVGGVVYWSPDFFGVDEEATYVEANAAFAVADGWTVSGAFGRQTLDVNADYDTWNAGVSWAFTEKAVVDVRYHDTDVAGPLSDDRIVAGIKFLF